MIHIFKSNEVSFLPGKGTREDDILWLASQNPNSIWFKQKKGITSLTELGNLLEAGASHSSGALWLALPPCLTLASTLPCAGFIYRLASLCVIKDSCF